MKKFLQFSLALLAIVVSIVLILQVVGSVAVIDWYLEMLDIIFSQS